MKKMLLPKCYFFYYFKSWNRKKYPFANLNFFKPFDVEDFLLFEYGLAMFVQRQQLHIFVAVHGLSLFKKKTLPEGVLHTT